VNVSPVTAPEVSGASTVVRALRSVPWLTGGSARHRKRVRGAGIARTMDALAVPAGVDGQA